MTTFEFKQQLNNMRTTLKSEETKLLDSMNHIMGCEMLCEQLMGALDTLTDEVVEDAENQTD